MGEIVAQYFEFIELKTIGGQAKNDIIKQIDLYFLLKKQSTLSYALYSR